MRHFTRRAAQRGTRASRESMHGSRYAAAILIVILVLVMGWAQAEAPKPSADEGAPLDLEQRWLDAGIADDRKAFDEILRDDFVDVAWYGRVRGNSVMMAAQSTTRPSDASSP